MSATKKMWKKRIINAFNYFRYDGPLTFIHNSLVYSSIVLISFGLLFWAISLTEWASSANTDQKKTLDYQLSAQAKIDKKTIAMPNYIERAINSHESPACMRYSLSQAMKSDPLSVYNVQTAITACKQAVKAYESKQSEMTLKQAQERAINGE